MSTALVWFRRDLRVHDHPPLAAALREHDRVVPVFVLDRRLLDGRFPSPPRAAFLLDALSELDAALRERGAGLLVRDGRPAEVLPALAGETGAAAVYLAGDVSPFARDRDRAVRAALEARGTDVVQTPGNFCADVSRPRTGAGKPYSVFSPFHRVWADLPRRAVEPAPDHVPAPPGLRWGDVPALSDLGLEPEPGLTDPAPAGEGAGRARMAAWLDGDVARYRALHDDLGAATSGLSPYLRFGCVSARELESRAAERDGDGPRAFRRQLAWRDFYAHVLLHFPGNATAPFQARFAALETVEDEAGWRAWRDGQTGYPLVDAAMRQLAATGYMHNRARMVAASFLTKDLHLPYGWGERWFMRRLLDGDEAQNNGNWQWTASLGVDPQPYFKRIFNPTRQQARFDPAGAYVRRWVPELRSVADDRLAEPSAMSADEQAAAGCRLGRDYPEPVVDHVAERRRAIARYRAAAAAGAQAGGPGSRAAPRAR